MSSFALLLIRLIIGLGMAAHGAQKGFGWFGGHGFKATGGFFEKLGFHPGGVFAALAVAGEIGGGVLTAAGLGGPLGPVLIVLLMIVAAGTMHIKNGFFTQNGGIEINLLYTAAAIVLTFAGPGAYSLDGALGLSGAYSDSLNSSTLIAGVVVGAAQLMIRRPTTA